MFPMGKAPAPLVDTPARRTSRPGWGWENVGTAGPSSPARTTCSQSPKVHPFLLMTFKIKAKHPPPSRAPALQDSRQCPQPQRHCKDDRNGRESPLLPTRCDEPRLDGRGACERPRGHFSRAPRQSGDLPRVAPAGSPCRSGRCGGRRAPAAGAEPGLASLGSEGPDTLPRGPGRGSRVPRRPASPASHSFQSLQGRGG